MTCGTTNRAKPRKYRPTMEPLLSAMPMASSAPPSQRIAPAALHQRSPRSIPTSRHAGPPPGS